MEEKTPPEEAKKPEEPEKTEAAVEEKPKDAASEKEEKAEKAEEDEADDGPALSMTEDKGKVIVQKLVDSWSKVFTNQVFFNYSEGNIWCYEVEFSTPKATKPITEGTVKCFFLTDSIDVACCGGRTPVRSTGTRTGPTPTT